ncbi:uncharacterized protein [Coffea arabica]|uniref:Uncharacterized protein n=1 Tax=Coffea arabica TaxID=13443 RepID=A0ABM4WGX1_COFAR
MSDLGHGECFWFIVSVVGTAIGLSSIVVLREYSGYGMLILFICGYIYFGLLLCSFVIHRHAQQKCIGNLGKLVVDVIATSAAMALRQLLGFNLCTLFALVGFTMDLHTVAQSLHIAYDVSIWDIMLESIMQVVAYLMWENKHMVTVVLMLVGAVTLYRYASYSPPVMPVVDSQLLEKQLC